MQLLKEIKAIIYKETLIEWRERYALNGLLLYIVSTVLICYLSFNLSVGVIQPITWNTLFWIILLFVAINAVAKSFMQERQARYLYYYSIISPQAMILAKILYNTILMLVIASLGFVFYSIVMGNPVQDKLLFFANILLGAFGFSSSLTMVSSIASKAQNSTTLMAVLGFPVIVPMLLMLIKISKNALDGLNRSVSFDEIMILLAINAIVLMVSYLLFPYLWRG